MHFLPAGKQHKNGTVALMLPGSSAPQLTGVEIALEPSVLMCQHQSQNLRLSPVPWWSPVYGPAHADPTLTHRYQKRAFHALLVPTQNHQWQFYHSLKEKIYYFPTQTSDLTFSNTQCVGVLSLTSVGRAAVESFKSISQSLRQLCFKLPRKCFRTYLLKQLSCSIEVSYVILFPNFLYY